MIPRAPDAPLDVQLQPGRIPTLPSTRVDDPVGWADDHREELRALVAEHGSLLVRGLSLPDHRSAAGVIGRLLNEPMQDTETFAPRTTYGDGVYSSTPWPAAQPMCAHHELSYRLEFPGLMAFACLQAPDDGGATVLADAAGVLAALPPALVERFQSDGWMLTRSFNGEIGATVLEAFGTEDPAEVDRYCRAHAIETTWQPDGSLRTRQKRAAVVRHPVTGRDCWFNQVAFLNEWTLAGDVRDYLVDEYGADGLPFNTAFGDGEPIGPDVVDLINETYEAHAVREPWHAGDLLLVDNVRTAHGRDPFHGHRDVLVGLGDPVRRIEWTRAVDGDAP